MKQVNAMNANLSVCIKIKITYVCNNRSKIASMAAAVRSEIKPWKMNEVIKKEDLSLNPFFLLNLERERHLNAMKEKATEIDRERLFSMQNHYGGGFFIYFSKAIA